MTTEVAVGPELDALVATEVMEQVPCDKWEYGNLGSAGGPVIWKRCDHEDNKCYSNNEHIPFCGPAEFSTSIQRVWEVVERMREFGYSIEIHQDSVFLDMTWRAEFSTVERGGQHYLGETAPEAICRTALAAVRA